MNSFFSKQYCMKGDENYETDLTDLKKLIEDTFNKYSRLDVIWNHAGIPGAGGFGNISEEEFTRY